MITADQTDPRRRMYEQNIILHPGIITSVAAVDEENGTVVLWMNFGHTGDAYGPGNALVTFEDDRGAYDQKDAEGFIKLFGMSSTLWAEVNKP